MARDARTQPVQEGCVKLNTAGTDSARQVQRILSRAYSEGYLGAVMKPDKGRINCIDRGPRFSVVSVQPGMNQSAGGRSLSPGKLVEETDSWLSDMEQRGYPFASASFGIDSFSGTTVFVSVRHDPGTFCAFDSLEMDGIRPGEKFISRVSGIRKGEPFSESSMKMLRSRFSAIHGYAVRGPERLYFSDERFVANTGLIRSRQDQLSALVGLATEPGSKPVFTGEVDLAFFDLFGAGVSLYADWRRFRARSQELLAGGEWPYPFGLPFILSAKLGLDRYDTLYSRFRRGLGFRFPAGPDFRFETGAEITGISRIWLDEEAVRILRRLPDNPNSRNSLFTLSGEYGRDPAGFLPVRGVFAKVTAGVGSRLLLRDARIEAISWMNAAGIPENIYDSLQRTAGLRQTQYRLDYRLEAFVPAASWFVVAMKALGTEFRSPRVFFSELNRWGGINDLRGYNEQSIFANRFHMISAEFRFMSGQSGYLAPFISGARYFNDAFGTSGKAWSTGIVAGIRTPAGILKLAWALGSALGEPMRLNAARIHAGLSNAF